MSRGAYGVLTLVLVGAIAWATREWGFTWLLPIFAAGPDVALLLGAGRGLERGRLHPRAVPLYNALHRFVGPAALLAASPLLGRSWTIGALAWGAHVALDRTVGYGLRTSEGYQRTRRG